MGWPFQETRFVGCQDFLLRRIVPSASIAVPSIANVDGSGAVLIDCDQVFEKIPPVVWAAAATAAMVVLLYCPEIMSVNAAELRIPLVSIAVPINPMETVTLVPT